MQLSDGFSRTFKYLRLSVTDVCNFRCNYCLPDGYQKCSSNQPLSQSEIVRAAKAFAGLGLSKIRLTGGEPTTRKDFDSILSNVAVLPNIRKLALTTNGYGLEKRASDWRNIGLNSLNISIDSLDPASFHRITGHDRFHEVFNGLHAALAAGFDTIKINSVYMKDINDNELDAFMTLARDLPISIRFIELMETGDHAQFYKKHYISTETIKDRLLSCGWQLKQKYGDSGPALEYSHPDYKGSVGIIAPYSKDFCKSCNRLRFSSFGHLHLCLFGDFGIPLRNYLKNDDQIEELQQKIITAVTQKTAGHQLWTGHTGMTSNLSSIGG